MVDTGSDVSLVPLTFPDNFKEKKCSKLLAANGSEIETYGKCDVNLNILGKLYNHHVIVANVMKPILGMDFFCGPGNDLVIDPSAKSIKRNNYQLCSPLSTSTNSVMTPQNGEVVVKNSLSRYSSLTSKTLGATESLTFPLKIDTGSFKPVFQKARPLYGSKLDEIKAELRKWEESGIIVRIKEPVQWASPIHAVRKSDGSWRICGDFRMLNNATISDKYPVPSLHSFNDKMHNCCIFSKIDLKSAYHQIKVAEEDQAKTTINTTLGLFKFVRMPFGLKNSGATCQRNLHCILRDMDFIFVYMDDVVIASSSFDEHLKHLQILFERLKNHHIIINEEKCEFAKVSLKFLGHELNNEGIRIPNSRIAAIKAYPKPSTCKELERFLGIFAFVHRFIPNASGIVSCLHDLRQHKTAKRFQNS